MHNEVHQMTNRISRRARAAAPLTVLAGALLFGACTVDKVLQVPDPDVSRPTDLTGPQALPTLLASAVGDFQVAFSGTGGGTGLEGLTNISGLFTDEFFFTETFPTRVQIDKRAIDRVNSNMRDIFFSVERSRASALRAETTYAKLAATDTGYAEALSLGGYSFLFLAEAYCSGVPVSGFNAAGQVVNGDPLTTQQLLDSAIARFTLAASIAGADNNTRLKDLALVGQARALLFKGRANIAAAAALVASVPTSFAYRIFSSSNTDRQNNGIWELNWNEKRWTQADSEAGIGLPFRSLADPRTPFVRRGNGFDQSTPLYSTLKYPNRDASVVLADGVEARLIEAEAALAAGDVPGELGILNTLRATVNLPALTDPGAANNARVLQLFHERAFWLYLTNHRLGDLRRLSRSVANGGYGLDPNTVFPSGRYQGESQGVYGNDVNFPIPVEEDNNPNFHGCIDRNP
jgi:starch-binding outer membrane protein, SusD/RagB family